LHSDDATFTFNTSHQQHFNLVYLSAAAAVVSNDGRFKKPICLRFRNLESNLCGNATEGRLDTTFVGDIACSCHWTGDEPAEQRASLEEVMGPLPHASTSRLNRSRSNDKVSETCD